MLRPLITLSIVTVLVNSFMPVVSAHAGGDYVSGKVVSFERDPSSFSFHQTEDRPPMRQGCQSFSVMVSHARVPRYSWLPLVRSSHPTREETEASLTLLEEAYRSQNVIQFGYMGGGLISDDEPCTFSSKGLRVGRGNDGDLVIFAQYGEWYVSFSPREIPPSDEGQ